MAKNSLETNIRRAMDDFRNIKAAMINNGEEVPTGTPTSAYAEKIGDKTYIFTTADGAEFPAVLVDEETVFTATANDIRIGAVAATEDGVTTGTKVIPSYNTTEGIKIVAAGDSFSLPIEEYEYTKLQALVCAFNTSLSDSVSTERVAINDNVYDVLSTSIVAEVTIDTVNKCVNFGFSNESNEPKLIRYFTYKEIY